MCFDDREIVRCSRDFGDGGVREAFPYFLGCSDAVVMMWDCGRLSETIGDVFYYSVAAMGGVKSSNDCQYAFSGR